MSQNRFPSLSNMARDVFNINIIIVAFELGFSMGGRILIKWRDKSENVEELVSARSWVFGFKMDGGKFYKHFF
mgnify:CR=1 FL=1